MLNQKVEILFKTVAVCCSYLLLTGSNYNCLCTAAVAGLSLGMILEHNLPDGAKR
jgi:hypothetical protein